MSKWLKSLVLTAFASVLIPLPSYSQSLDEEGCVLNRRIHPEGTEMCQGDSRVRCEGGAWADIGMCDGDEPGPAPIGGGGNVPIDEE
jgi:hypothetical protein